MGPRELLEFLPLLIAALDIRWSDKTASKAVAVICREIF
jgi:hypothetical protein